MKPEKMNDHPEGGRFLEVFRSSETVIREDGAQRTALTHIYFSLQPGEVSKFHRVAADEVWNLYEGEGLILLIWNEETGTLSEQLLSSKENSFCHVVPAGNWQAASPIGPKAVLVGCTVAPGFEFDDFTLITPASDQAKKILATNPSLNHFI